MEEENVTFSFNLRGIKSKQRREEIEKELQRLLKVAESMEAESEEGRLTHE